MKTFGVALVVIVVIAALFVFLPWPIALIIVAGLLLWKFGGPNDNEPNW